MSRQFLQAFRCAKFEVGQFAHKDHVFAAWLMLRELPLDQAAIEFADCIMCIAVKFAVPEKFHATITHALMVIIASRIDPGESWEHFWSSNCDIADDAMSLLNVYYSRSLLYSNEARQKFVPPDLNPLPITADTRSALSA